MLKSTNNSDYPKKVTRWINLYEKKVVEETRDPSMIANAVPADGAHFGEHFMIDGYKGSRDRLSDRRVVQRCLDELPEKLGMRKLAEPTVLWVEPNGIRDPGGWSGFVVIAESHLSIHTFPGRLYASIDVYTCRNGLATADIEAYFREAFGFVELETNFVKRGKKYPLTDC